MKNTLTPIVLALAAVASPAATFASTILFNGGAPNQVEANEDTAWVQADDFVLGASSTVTDGHFWTGELGSWDGTLQWFIFADAGGAPGAAPLFSGNGVNVVRTPTGNIVAGIAPEFEYSFDLDNPVSLAGGTTYWFGLHQAADFAGAGIYWETTGSGFGLTGRDSLGGTFDNWSAVTGQHAFYLTGSEVPEPATLVLLGLGLSGLGLNRRKKA